MNAPQKLHDAGQSLWLDNIHRELLTSGTLNRYISELAVTGLTSNPSIFEHAIAGTSDYDETLLSYAGKGLSAEQVFFDLALQDIIAAADIFLPIHKRTAAVDGFVSLEVSPALADDAEGTIAEAKRLHGLAMRNNLFIKIPGTDAGLTAIEHTIAAGIPVNVTLLFSAEQYLAAAEAYAKGVARRIKAGRDPNVASVASVFISRWDVAANPHVPAELRDRLGIAVGQQCYAAYRQFLESERWERLKIKGAKPQRLLFASTGTKNPERPDTYYISALAAPDTVNTMPEKTLIAFGDHGEVTGVLRNDGGDSERALAHFTAAGVNLPALGKQLQLAGRDAFVKDFQKLLACVDSKVNQLHAKQGEPHASAE
jgi:transaldolase